MTDSIEARLAAALSIATAGEASPEQHIKAWTRQMAEDMLEADPTLICPDPAAHSLRDPFSVWQGVCGHLWRKVDDGEECPYCADLALAAAVPEFYQQRHNGRAECVICGGFKPTPGDTTGLAFGGHHQGCPFLTRGPER